MNSLTTAAEALSMAACTAERRRPPAPMTVASATADSCISSSVCRIYAVVRPATAPEKISSKQRLALSLTSSGKSSYFSRARPSARARVTLRGLSVIKVAPCFLFVLSRVSAWPRSHPSARQAGAPSAGWRQGVPPARKHGGSPGETPPACAVSVPRVRGQTCGIC